MQCSRLELTPFKTKADPGLLAVISPGVHIFWDYFLLFSKDLCQKAGVPHFLGMQISNFTAPLTFQMQTQRLGSKKIYISLFYFYHQIKILQIIIHIHLPYNKQEYNYIMLSDKSCKIKRKIPIIKILRCSLDLCCLLQQHTF